MLWFRLLKITRYCGKLKASNYRIYAARHRSESVVKPWKGEGKGQEFRVLLKHAYAGMVRRMSCLPAQWVALSQHTHNVVDGGGPVWTKLLLP